MQFNFIVMYVTFIYFSLCMFNNFLNTTISLNFKSFIDYANIWLQICLLVLFRYVKRFCRQRQHKKWIEE